MGELNTNKLTVLVLALIIVTSITSIGTAAEIIVKPGDSIQDSINSAASGDTIIVKPGTYTENIKVTKDDLTIRSKSGNPDDTIIEAKNSGDNVFLLQADNVEINGFKISGSIRYGYAGIFLSSGSHCKIENNKLLSNSFGIYLLKSKSNTISKNIVSDSDRGIYLKYAGHNTLSGNTVTDNDEYGTNLQNSMSNVLSGNLVFKNARGIYFDSSGGNTITGCTIRNNNVYGLYVRGTSKRNTVYNNYFNDTSITIQKGAENAYNISKTAGTNIVGGPFIGGNYWAKPDGTGFSQKAVDKNSDGMSDSAYTNINGGEYSDYLPLVITPKSSDSNILPVADSDNNNVVTTNSGVNGAPVASFRLSTYMTTINNPITLYDTSSGSPSSWSWTVKNSAGTTVFTSKSQNPTWTPTSADQYSVTLIATNSGGSNTLTKSNKYLIVGSGVAYNSSSNYITWLGDEYLCGYWPMPVGSLSVDPRNVWVDASNRMHCDVKKWSNVWTGGEAQSTAQIKYGIIRWTVESPRMGNVDPNIDMGTFTYGDPEDYNELDFEICTWGKAIENTMTNTVHHATGSGDQEHFVQPFLAPTNKQPMIWQADWQPGRVIFSMWYADGTLYDTWTETNYVPNTPASIENMIWPLGTPTDNQPEYIIVDNLQVSQAAPVTDFYADVTSGTAPLTVKFTDTSTNIPTSYNWNFGDGSTSTSQNPIHKYASPGTYTVTESTSNYYGSNTMTKKSYITVGNR